MTTSKRKVILEVTSDTGVALSQILAHLGQLPEVSCQVLSAVPLATAQSVIAQFEGLSRQDRDKVTAYIAAPVLQQQRRERLIASSQAQRQQPPPTSGGRSRRSGLPGSDQPDVSGGKPNPKGSKKPPKTGAAGPMATEKKRLKAINSELANLKKANLELLGDDGRLDPEDTRLTVAVKRELKALLKEQGDILARLRAFNAGRQVPCQSHSDTEGAGAAISPKGEAAEAEASALGIVPAPQVTLSVLDWQSDDAL